MYLRHKTTYSENDVNKFIIKNGVMIRKTTLRLSIVVLLMLLGNVIFAQKETIVSGTVRDAESGEPLAGATIIVKGKVLGTSTDLDGNFNFGITLPPPFVLVFSSVGYEIREYEVIRENQVLNVNLRPQALIEPEVVVYGSRLEETVMQSPISIQKRDLSTIRHMTTPDFYSGIAEIKDVQMLNNSLVYNTVNARGFSSIGNTRFVQVIDGMDNSPPGLNFAIGNFAGVSELDIAEIELVHGAASALYGPSAFNGILFMNTKNPFDYEGLSVSLQNGITVQEAAGTNTFIKAGVRYAEVVNDNFGIKFNLEAIKGTEWFATDYRDMANSLSDGRGMNPDYDGVNVYGDEIVTTLDLDAISGQPDGTFGSIRVARTGYNEENLTNNDAQVLKGDISMHYRMTETVSLIGSYRAAIGNTLFQGANRYAFRDISMQQVKLELKGENFFLRGYNTYENSGKSYDMRFLGWNLNNAWKDNTTWFQEYAGAYLGGITGVPSFDHDAARTFADRNRLNPNTPEFDQMVDSLTNIADLTRGAKFLDKTSMFHLEAMYDLSQDLGNVVEFLIGGNFRSFRLNSEGTLFNDADGPIRVNEFGTYAQVGKGFGDEERLKLNASIRYDKNNNFDGQFTPRASVVYSMGAYKQHNLRASYQTGFRNPETQAQYIALNIGVANLLGGVSDNAVRYNVQLPYIDNMGMQQFASVTGMDVYDNSYTAGSVQAFSAAVGDSIAIGYDPLTAAVVNAGVLQQANIDYVKPERVTSYEFGYRGIINKRFFVDMNYHFSQYTNFIAPINVVHPLLGDVTDVTTFTGVQDIAAGRTSIYQLYSNASEKVTSRGFSIQIDYALQQGFRLGGNYTYADFDLGNANPDLVPGFNTPEHRYTLSFGNRNIYKGFGFNISHRWSDEYLWQSAFGTGRIDGFNITNLQMTYEIPNTAVRIKAGGSNIFQNEYRTAFGTPLIGAQYFITLTYNEFL